jgi:hypothetical protein
MAGTPAVVKSTTQAKLATCLSWSTAKHQAKRLCLNCDLLKTNARRYHKVTERNPDDDGSQEWTPLCCPG